MYCHRYAAGQPEAAALALAAGADLALGGGYDAAGQPQSFAALGQALKLNLTTPVRPAPNNRRDAHS